MKKVLIMTCVACLLAVTNANAQNAAAPNTKQSGPAKPAAKTVQVPADAKIAVAPPLVPATDIAPTVSDKVNNSATDMPKPVKGNENVNTPQARPTEPKIPDSRTVMPPAKPADKEVKKPVL